MTVAENIGMTLGFPRRLGLIDWDAARRRAAFALEALGADIDPDTRIQNLSRTEKSLVAIARALAAEPEILVLDEPTASLPADEVARLFSALRRLRARGVAMIYVSHRLDEVFEIADRMIVLRDGRVAGEREVAKTTPDETILLIVGREPSQVFRRPPDRQGSPRLALTIGHGRGGRPRRLHDQFRRDRRARRASRRGPGERRARAVRRLAGDRRTGPCSMDAKSTVAPPREAMARGVNLICADRVGESIMPNLSVRENLFLNPVAAGLSVFSLISPGRESQVAKERGAQLGLRPNDPALPIELLSGGNQQKVVVGRWLHLDARIYVFEDPTAGVDVGAKAEIYRLFDVALQRGAAIFIVSTDFEEVAKVCHRALIFDRGRVVAELGADDLSVENLLAAASANIRRSAPPSAASGEGGGAHAVH